LRRLADAVSAAHPDRREMSLGRTDVHVRARIAAILALGIGNVHCSLARPGARHTDETSTQTEETTMSTHDEARRAFLVGAAVTGAAAGAALVPEAYAKDDPRKNAQKNGAAEHAHASARGHGTFFNDADSLTIEAFTERLMP